MIRGEEGKVILSRYVHLRLNLGYCVLDGNGKLHREVDIDTTRKTS